MTVVYFRVSSFGIFARQKIHVSIRILAAPHLAIKPTKVGPVSYTHLTLPTNREV